tara:strand:- start:64 stop:618 length:555 start_codon:yes stop_codon:yes gene_type:complete
MKKKILTSLILLLPISIYSFEDLYLQCGKKEGYYNIVFGLTQTWGQWVNSIAQGDDYVTAQVATSSYNDFLSGEAYKSSRVGEDYISIGRYNYDYSYRIDRITGKAYSLKEKWYSPEEKNREISKCIDEAKINNRDWNTCSLAVSDYYVESTFLGNCSIISSQSTAKKYADKLYTPPKKIKKKF